jgi:drug/metabolite transporter (DMT)-like permease
MLAAFLTTILFSTSAVCGNRTAKLLGGTEANFARLCVAAILLAIYGHTLGGGIAGSAFWMPRLGSRLSVLLTLCLSSPLAALIEWRWLHTQLSMAEIVCALVILAGVAVALAPGGHVHIARHDLCWGLSFGLLASFCQALGAVLSRKGFALAQAAGENIDGITAAYQRILGGVLLGAAVFAVVKFNRKIPRPDQAGAEEEKPTSPWRRAWPLVLINGLAGPALGVSCYQWALKTTPTGVVLPIVAITPIVIIPFSFYLEGERPGKRSLLGGAIAVAGAAALAWVKTP